MTDKALEKAFITFAKPEYGKKVAPTMATAKRCGNMYTGSLYGGLAVFSGFVLFEYVL